MMPRSAQEESLTAALLSIPRRAVWAALVQSAVKGSPSAGTTCETKQGHARCHPCDCKGQQQSYLSGNTLTLCYGMFCASSKSKPAPGTGNMTDLVCLSVCLCKGNFGNEGIVD